MLICPYTKEKIVSVPRRGEIMRDETKMDVYTSGVTGAEYDYTDHGFIIKYVRMAES